MSDYASSLPIRTQNNGDVVVNIADGTTKTQLLAIDSTGRPTIKLDDGSGNAITSQASGSQRALDVGIDVSGVQIDPRQIRTLTSSDVVTANQGTSPWVVAGNGTAGTPASGVLSIQGVTGGTVVPISGTVTANQGGAPWSQNITQVLGAAPSATNALATQISTGGAYVSSTNPLPVTIDPAAAGTPKNYYTDSASVAVGSSVTQSTTVGGTTGFYVQQVYCTGEGKFKAIVQIETASGSGTFNVAFASFNSTANPNVIIPFPQPTLVPTGARIQVIMTNNDLGASDLYSTVSGYQI